METKGKIKGVFDDKLKFRNLAYLSDFEKNVIKYEKQQFVVPWQMEQSKESELRFK